MQSAVRVSSPNQLDWSTQPLHLLHPSISQQYKVRTMLGSWCLIPILLSMFHACSVTYLEVNNYLVNKTITNVIATIYGAVEPGKNSSRNGDSFCKVCVVCVDRSLCVGGESSRCLDIWWDRSQLWHCSAGGTGSSSQRPLQQESVTLHHCCLITVTAL